MIAWEDTVKGIVYILNIEIGIDLMGPIINHI